MKKNFYVCDSYHTGSIADQIRQAFPDSKVYIDSTIVSICVADPELTAQNFLQKASSEKTIQKDDVRDKIDYFILSARLIIDGSANVDTLKQKYGHPLSKTIAVSMSDHFLREVAGTVDFAEEKTKFLDRKEIISFFGNL